MKFGYRVIIGIFDNSRLLFSELRKSDPDQEYSSPREYKLNLVPKPENYNAQQSENPTGPMPKPQSRRRGDLYRVRLVVGTQV